MRRYLLTRLGQLVVIMFVISILTFLLVHLLPGNPVDTILGPNQTPANRAALLKQLGLEQAASPAVLDLAEQRPAREIWASRSSPTRT